MRKSLWVLSALAVAAAAFTAGTWVGWRSATTPSGTSAARRVLAYTCPMHPAYRSDKPGDCPSCGMRLVPVYSDDSAGGLAGPAAHGTLQISPERQQVIGIRTGRVEASPAAGTIRTAGRVAADENRVFRLLAASDGLVRRIYNNSTGALVQKNEPLLTFYSREFLGAEQAYFFALQTYDRYLLDAAPPEQLNVGLTQIRSTIETLQNLGMGDVQIAALAKSRVVTTDIELRSPVDGCVLARSVTPQQRFDRGAELYRIADLSRVWVVADIAARESYPLKPGTKVRILAPYGATRSIDASVSDVLPQFDPETRTLKLRLEANNADYALRPDMFVEVELPVSLPRAVTVPVDALVDSGLKKTVYVDRGNGYFEPRRVEVGWRFEDRVEILRGLMPGERIVLSGTFLLDSESRMKAAAGVEAPGQDPVCGMEVDEVKAKAAGRSMTYGGRTYYFCSDQCRKDFEASPAKYARRDAATDTAPAPTAPAPLPFGNGTYAHLPGLESVPGGLLAPQAPIVARPRPLGAAPTAQAPSSPAQPTAPDAAPNANAPPTPPPAPQGRKMSRDPVCGLPVGEEDATSRGLTSQYQGRAFFFSSAECKTAFDKEPAKYIQK